jgi:hypothetical protein
MVFCVLLCLTVQREYLLSRNMCDIAAVATVEQPTKKKEDTIFKIIDNVLKQVFGEEATLFIYKFLERNYSLRQSEFSEKIDTFAKGLEDCLSSGAFAVECRILDDICSKYGAFHDMDFEGTPDEYDFASKIRIALQSA